MLFCEMLPWTLRDFSLSLSLSLSISGLFYGLRLHSLSALRLSVIAFSLIFSHDLRSSLSLISYNSRPLWTHT